MINWCQVEANYTIKLIIIIEMKPPGYVSTEGRPSAPFAHCHWCVVWKIISSVLARHASDVKQCFMLLHNAQ